MCASEPGEGCFLPILPAREVVLYPKAVTSLYVGRVASVKAIEMAMLADQKVVLLAQKDPNTDQVSTNSLYKIGVMAKILQVFKLPDGTLKVLLEGRHRVKCLAVEKTGHYFTGSFEMLVTTGIEEVSTVSLRLLYKCLDRYAELQPKKIPDKQLDAFKSTKDECQLIEGILVEQTFYPLAVESAL